MRFIGRPLLSIEDITEKDIISLRDITQKEIEEGKAYKDVYQQSQPKFEQEKRRLLREGFSRRYIEKFRIEIKKYVVDEAILDEEDTNMYKLAGLLCLPLRRAVPRGYGYCYVSGLLKFPDESIFPSLLYVDTNSFGELCGAKVLYDGAWVDLHEDRKSVV